MGEEDDVVLQCEEEEDLERTLNTEIDNIKRKLVGVESEIDELGRDNALIEHRAGSRAIATSRPCVPIAQLLPLPCRRMAQGIWSKRTTSSSGKSEALFATRNCTTATPSSVKRRSLRTS